MRYRRENILVITHEGVIKCIVTHLFEDLQKQKETPIIFLSNHLHWVSYYRKRKLERVNALPLP